MVVFGVRRYLVVTPIRLTVFEMQGFTGAPAGVIAIAACVFSRASNVW